mmetsp:Transcript_10102/g.23817  ORF Transcript_10102/g.23817 Transcript_10102/m.23817 type:complete len:350 (-) Transcript_10102:744-1793(-)
MLRALRAIFPDIRSLPTQVQLVECCQRIVHSPRDLRRSEPLAQGCDESGNAQRDRNPNGEVSGTQPHTHAQDQYQRAVEHHSQTRNVAHPAAVVLLQRSHAQLDIGLRVDWRCQVLHLWAIQECAPGISPARAPEEVPDDPARPGHRPDAVVHAVHLLLQELKVLRGGVPKLVSAIVAPDQVLLADARHGQALDHVPQALQKPLLVCSRGSTVRRDISEEEKDLGDDPAGAHVYSGPRLGNLEAALNCHQEQHRDGKNNQGDVQDPVVGQGKLAKREVNLDHCQGSTHEHEEGNGHCHGCGKPAEVSRASDKLEVQVPAFEDQGAVNFRGTQFLGARVVAREHRHQRGD